MPRREQLPTKHVEGIQVIDQHEKLGHDRCKRWLFRVWNPWLRRWKPSRAWDGLPDGWSWAERERAKYTLGERRATTGSFTSLAAEFVQSLRDADPQPAGQPDKKHVRDVKRILDHLVERGVVDLDADDFAQRVRSVLATTRSFAKGRKQAIAGRTRNRWLRQVRACISHGLQSQLIRHDPLAPLRRFKFEEDDTATESFTIPELRQLVAPAMERDPLFLQVALMVYAGFRVREAAHVRWEWIDWRARFIRVRLSASFKTKRRKERQIPLTDELAAILEAQSHRQLHGWVIRSAEQRARKDWEHYDAFKAYLAAAGVTRADLHPHSTRHTWTAIMLATGASATLVRRSLGHSSLTTTDDYADAEMQVLRDVRGWPAGEFFLRREPAGVEAAKPAAAAAAVPAQARNGG